MATTERQVFVIERRHDAALAFEAVSFVQALELLQTPWLAGALDDFHRRHRSPSSRCPPAHVRAATVTEAARYRGLADEFADASDRFLVAKLSDEL